MDTNDKPCRHEYVKIFQRKYKDFGRRLVSTRGYLPTGFSSKDFSFLAVGTRCFCTQCYKRLYPMRSETTKLDLVNPLTEAIDPQIEDAVDNIWTEDNSTASINPAPEIDVVELQIEPTEVTDIVDKGIKVNIKEEAEEGEE